jgi:DNA polymerase-3 subunit gamma/tau
MAFIKQALQQVAFPSTGEGIEKKNSLKLSSVAENSYNYSIEQKVEQNTKSPKTALADTEEDYNVKGEAVEDNTPPIIEKESLLSKLKTKKSSLLSSLKSEVEEDEFNYSKAEAMTWSIASIQEIWEIYCNEIDSPSSQVLYKGAIFEIKEGSDQIFVTAKSSRAKDAILRDNALLEKMRSSFSKSNLQFAVEIEEGPAEEIVKPKVKPQSDRDKYSYFMQMNPLLADFQKRFGLYPADYNPKKK